MTVTKRYRVIVMLGLALALGLSLMQPGGASAQTADYELHIGASGDAFEALPDQTIAINVRDAADDTHYGTCRLDLVNIPGGCAVYVPGATTVIAEVDEGTVPEGVAVAENPIAYDVPEVKTGIGDIVFTFEYVDDVEEPGPGPDVSLPNTGSGFTESDAFSALPAGMLIGAFLMAAMALRIRRLAA